MQEVKPLSSPSSPSGCTAPSHGPELSLHLQGLVGGGQSEKTLTAMCASLAQPLLSADWLYWGLCPHILPVLPFSFLSGTVL